MTRSTATPPHGQIAPRVVVVGDNCLDEYAGDIDVRVVGGNAVNVAVQLQGLQVAAAYAGAVGEDGHGRAVVAALREQQVDVRNVVVLDGHTGLTRIRVAASGERTFTHEDFGVSADFRVDDGLLAVLTASAVVHLGMLRDADHRQWLRRHLRAAGVLVTQDCSVSPGCTDLDIGFLSVDGPESHAREAAHRMVAEGAGLAVITRGANGSLAFDGHDWWTQSAMPTDVVDTTGAGDAFIAGFLAERLDNGTVAACMKAAATTAATACTHFGGWPQPSEPRT